MPLNVKTKLCNSFRFKDPIPKDLISGYVYKFNCGLCNESYYGESMKHLNIRSGEHIVMSPFIERRPNQSITALYMII